MDGELPERDGSGAVAPGGDPGKEDRAAAGIPVVPVMDGFRAFSIVAVIVFHMILITGLPDGGAARVALFGTLPNLIDALFIISGFVVFLPTVARGGRFGSVGGYAIRRAARLVPAYWLVIALTGLFLLTWPGLPPADPGFNAGNVAVHAVFMHMPILMLDGGFDLGFEINGALWTLSLEVTFYLLLPLIAGAWFRRPFLGLLLAALMTIAWKEAVLNLEAVTDAFGVAATPDQLARLELAANNQFPAWAFSFGLGMTAAWVYVRLRAADVRERVARVAPAALLLSLAAFALSSYLIGRNALDRETLVPHLVARQDPAVSMFFSAALCAVMLSCALAPARWQWPWRLAPARALGDISYGMYLIHAPLALFVLAAAPGLVDGIGGLATLVLIAVPVTVIYGWASARWLEQPIRRWARRYGRRGTEDSPAGHGSPSRPIGPRPAP